MKLSLYLFGIIIMGIGISRASTTLTEGLVAYWNYDGGQKEDPANYTDTSMNWDSQWVSNTTYPTSGGLADTGYASLNGASGFYTSSANLNTTTGFSISFACKDWGSNNIINLNDGTSNAILKIRFDKFTLETTGDFLGTSGSSITERGNALSSSSWQRLTLVCTNGNLSMFINGTKFETDTTWTGTINTVQIASVPAHGDWNTTGSLDDVAFWNRALTDEEALSLSTAPIVAIPEPATASLSLLTLTALLIRRKKN